MLAKFRYSYSDLVNLLAFRALAAQSCRSRISSHSRLVMPASMAKGSDDSMEPTLWPFSVQAQRKQHRRDGIARSTTGYRYVKFNGFIVERLQALHWSSWMLLCFNPSGSRHPRWARGINLVFLIFFVPILCKCHFNWTVKFGQGTALDTKCTSSLTTAVGDHMWRCVAICVTICVTNCDNVQHIQWKCDNMWFCGKWSHWNTGDMFPFLDDKSDKRHCINMRPDTEAVQCLSYQLGSNETRVFGRCLRFSFMLFLHLALYQVELYCLQDLLKLKLMDTTSDFFSSHSSHY